MNYDHDNLAMIIGRGIQLGIAKVQEVGKVAHIFPNAALSAVAQARTALKGATEDQALALVLQCLNYVEAVANEALAEQADAEAE